MAKLRRTPSRPATKKPTKTPTRVGKAGKPAAVGQKPKKRTGSPPLSQAPVRRSTYADAVLVYERGLEAIQQHDYKRAMEFLRSVLVQFPEEKELHERAQLYLKVCERHVQPADGTPRSPAERVYAATLAFNSGAYDRAVEFASSALAADNSLDTAEYILASALTQRGDTAGALAHLQRAIELNPENRELARRDADLDALRRSDEARNVLSASAAAARRDRRSAAFRPRGPVR